MRLFSVLFAVTCSVNAYASGTLDSPSWLAELDPEAMEATDDKVYDSGSLASLKGGVLVGSGPTERVMSLPELLKAGASGVREGAELAYLKGALRSPPTHMDSFTEYSDRYLIHLVTEVDVVDPDLFASYVDGFVGTFNSKLSMQDLSKDEVDTLWSIVNKPSAYYLSREDLAPALEAGDAEALLHAMMDGQGLARYTQNVTIYKLGHGPVDAKIEAVEMSTSPVITAEEPLLSPDRIADDMAPPPETETSHNVAKRNTFVFGWMFDESPEDEHRWDIGVGFIRVSYGSVLRAGVRLPYRVTHTTYPTSIVGPGVVPVAIDSRVEGIDATADDYEDVGLNGWGGDEASLVARVWMGAKVYAFGHDWVHIKNPSSKDRSRGGDLVFDLVNMHENFTAPFDGDTLNHRFVLPAEDSGLAINYGILSAGFDLGLRADVVGDEVRYGLGLQGLSSWDGDHFRFAYTTKDYRTSEFLQFPEEPGAFGWTLDDPTLQLGLDLTPGMSLDLTVHLEDILHIDIPWSWNSPWFEPITLRAGTITLDSISDLPNADEGLVGHRAVR